MDPYHWNVHPCDTHAKAFIGLDWSEVIDTAKDCDGCHMTWIKPWRG